MPDTKKNQKYSISKDGDETTPFGYRSACDLAFGRHRDPLDELLSDFGVDPTQQKEPAPKVEPPKKVKTEAEKKQEELNRLHRLLYEKDQEFEKAKGRRTNLVVLAFAVFYFVVIMAIGGKTNIVEMIEGAIDACENIWSFLGVFVFPFVLSWIHVVINGTIFSSLTHKAIKGNEELDSIRKRIREIEKTLY